MGSDKTWSVVELLSTAAGMFAEKGTGEPRLSAELLLGHVLGLQRIELYLNHERTLTRLELEAFRAGCRERLQGRPVQYIVGETFFYGRRFTVDKRVLIPRPETELVVEHAIERFGASCRSGHISKLLDIGTGSGCIAVTLALMEPRAQVTAVDISEGALDVARLNAREHGVEDRIRFLHADMCDPDFAVHAGGPFDLVVSNPPYIPQTEWAGLQEEVKCHEPRLALDAPAGFEYYTCIAAGATRLVRVGGVLCFELHADAAEGVRLLLPPGFGEIIVMRDYAGLDRALSCIREH